MRMTLPCRSSTCDHLQCFDASLYLMMNEKKPKWMCPVCNKPAMYENLLIDGYFSDILTSKRLPYDEHEIVLHNNASWDPLVPAKRQEDKKPKIEPPSSPRPSSSNADMPDYKANKVETFSVDDEEVDDDEPPFPPSSSSGPLAPVPFKQSDEVDLVCLDSDSEDEIAPPSSKRPRMILDDEEDNSDSVSALTPASVSPNPMLSAQSSTSSAYSTSSLAPPPPQPLPSDSPELICLDDDD